MPVIMIKFVGQISAAPHLQKRRFGRRITGWTNPVRCRCCYVGGLNDADLCAVIPFFCTSFNIIETCALFSVGRNLISLLGSFLYPQKS